MKILRTLVAAAVLGVPLTACDDFLKRNPVGVISGDDLNTPANVKGMVVSAYSTLGNDHWDVPYSSLWPYGNMRAGDAYKGGGGTGDQNDYNNMEQFVYLLPSEGKVDRMWYSLYVGISRANDAL